MYGSHLFTCHATRLTVFYYRDNHGILPDRRLPTCYRAFASVIIYRKLVCVYVVPTDSKGD